MAPVICFGQRSCRPMSLPQFYARASAVNRNIPELERQSPFLFLAQLIEVLQAADRDGTAAHDIAGNRQLYAPVFCMAMMLVSRCPPGRRRRSPAPTASSRLHGLPDRAKVLHPRQHVFDESLKVVLIIGKDETDAGETVLSKPVE
jgi:hypothetical protein